jgi:hypothetical protein
VRSKCAAHRALSDLFVLSTGISHKKPPTNVTCLAFRDARDVQGWRFSSDEEYGGQWQFACIDF